MTDTFVTDMERSLHQDLIVVLLNWDPEEALQLSDRLHAYEVDGGVLSEATDRLWLRLTIRLEQEK